MSDQLAIAIEAVKRGSQKALKYFGNNPDVTIKPDHTPVTTADKESELAIKEFIQSVDKQAQFIGEESGGSLEADEAWIIDPVDGTKNFMRGLSSWAILLAHYKNGMCDIGVSYVPALNQMCYAQRGHGAFINGEKIQVSRIEKLEEAYFSHGELRYFNDMHAFTKLSHAVLTERGIGDAFSYNLLASGKIDIMVDGRSHAWDAAPFTVIIEEAGGKVSNLNGDPWSIHDLDFVATNGHLHDQVIAILRSKR